VGHANGKDVALGAFSATCRRWSPPQQKELEPKKSAALRDQLTQELVGLRSVLGRRGEVGPEDLSANLLGLVIEDLNRQATGAAFRVSAYADGFFNRAPSPPPFFSMNSMPASSSARRIARSFGPVNEVAAPVSSARRIVVSPTDDECARSSALQRRSARAARICALVSAWRKTGDCFIPCSTFHSMRTY
jgi:hypothetical protein